MDVMEQLRRLGANLLRLGMRRLLALAAIGIAVFGLTGFVGYYLSRPSMEVLYAGLDRQDVSSIGAALHDADVGFDVSSDGTAVMVRYGQTAQARMLLAEKGLPHSTNAGYELYDKMGSLGLTSFMQDVTRLRALEGELSRTIQTMAGIRAARVHIVLPDEGSFRRTKQPASASVVIRAATLDDTHTAQAIRHLVASAVPGMTPDQVTVLSTDGMILASGDDAMGAAPGRMLDLERSVGKSIQDNVRKTLAPSLGVDNLQISVEARLNTDTRQVAETVYNPDGRVERSTRTVKETSTQQNSAPQAPTSVSQNLPQSKTSPTDSKQSSQDSQKKEDLTNYEISSKTTTTVSSGFAIERLSIAVVLNRAPLLASLGEKPGSEIDPKKLAEIEQLAASAAGLDKARGDTIKVMAVDFIDASHEIEPVPPPAIMDAVLRQSGTLINAGMVLLVTILVGVLVVRPLTRVLLAPPPLAATSAGLVELPMEPTVMLPDPALGSRGEPAPVTYTGGLTPEPADAAWADESDGSLIADLTSRQRRSPQKRLEQMIEYDEQHAAQVLKQWIQRGAAA